MLTRPLEDSTELILKFKSLGHKVSHLPVIKINKIELLNLDFANYAGIIFTSANALKNLDTKSIKKISIVFV